MGLPLSFYAMLAIFGVSAWAVFKASSPIREANRSFTEEENAEFAKLLEARTKQVDMPSKYHETAAAFSKVKGIYYLSFAAMLLWVVGVIFLGWDFGLTPNP